MTKENGATQAIFPPPQWRIQYLSHMKVVISGWLGQTRHLDAETKPAYDPQMDEEEGGTYLEEAEREEFYQNLSQWRSMPQQW